MSFAPSTPSPGKCKYCRKEGPTPVTRRIIYRTRCETTRKAKVVEEPFQFCSEQCGLHYQYSCEG